MIRPLVNAWIQCEPVACARPRFDSKRRRTYTSKRSEDGAAAQAALLSPHGPREQLVGALSVSLSYVLAIPASWSGKQQAAHMWAPHTQRPDADNLAKTSLDAMTRLKWWGDDSQVSRLVVSKRWGDVPGVHVVIERLA